MNRLGDNNDPITEIAANTKTQLLLIQRDLTPFPDILKQVENLKLNQGSDFGADAIIQKIKEELIIINQILQICPDLGMANYDIEEIAASTIQSFISSPSPDQSIHFQEVIAGQTWINFQSMSHQIQLLAAGTYKISFAVSLTMSQLSDPYPIMEIHNQTTNLNVPGGLPITQMVANVYQWTDPQTMVVHRDFLLHGHRDVAIHVTQPTTLIFMLSNAANVTSIVRSQTIAIIERVK